MNNIEKVNKGLEIAHFFAALAMLVISCIQLGIVISERANKE